MDHQTQMRIRFESMAIMERQPFFRQIYSEQEYTF